MWCRDSVIQPVLRSTSYAVALLRSMDPTKDESVPNYCDWIKRFVLHLNMKSRDDLCDGEKKIETFLTFLARDKKVAPSTQNQALNALVFLYKKVLKQPLNEKINAERASKKVKIPVVLAHLKICDSYLSV